MTATISGTQAPLLQQFRSRPWHDETFVETGDPSRLQSGSWWRAWGRQVSDLRDFVGTLRFVFRAEIDPFEDMP